MGGDWKWMLCNTCNTCVVFYVYYMYGTYVFTYVSATHELHMYSYTCTTCVGYTSVWHM